MRTMRFDVALICSIALVAGCSEIGSTPSHGVGPLAVESPDDGGADDGRAKAKSGNAAAEAEATPPASLAQTQVVKPSETPAGTQKISAEATAAMGEAASGEKNTTTKPAAAASDGHLAPQQVARGGDGRARNITFDNIKFPMDDPKSRMFKREMLTEPIEKLSGTRVRVRGFIFPGGFDEFSNFILVRDNQECCFGPGSAIYDSMMVNMADGQIVKFTTRPITVEGVFEVKELIGPDKKHWSIYRLTATKVE